MKQIINSKQAPAAIGPYVQATRINDVIYTSGAIPLHHETGEVVGVTIKEQATQAMNNLKAVLEEAGASMDSIVKTTCFISDLNNFVEFNEVYGSYFGEVAPSRSCVEVARLPKDVLIEVEAIAIVE